MRFGTTTVLSTLLLLGAAAGCSDLDVENPNEPDRGRALSSAGDIESLIGSSFHEWWDISHDDDGSPAFWMGNVSFEYAAWPANFAEVDYSSIPRAAIENDPAAADRYDYFVFPWTKTYRALAAVRDGLRAIESDADIQDDLGEDGTLRARAFGKFMQGVGTGTLALFYDQGFILDETVETTDAGGKPVALEPASYQEMMDKALSYLDEAIALSEQGDFTVPAEWMSVDVTSDELARISHSLKARYRAEVARTPEERAAVDWQAVQADIEAGVEDGWDMMLKADFSSPWRSEFLQYIPEAAWSQTSYFITGMADQSGSYQEWLSAAPTERMPDLADGPFLIVTPDERFPRGATLEEQEASPGTLFEIPTTSPTNPYSLANNWQHPERGTYRWSYYRTSEFDEWDYYLGAAGPIAEIPAAEMRLLNAEAAYRLGDKATAAELVNVSRTAAGLSATNAAGLNTSCVPKLPSGACGDLFEMLKWVKRLETQFKGLFGAPWYFDGRGWGDLYKGTPLHLPVPCQEMQVLGNPACYTFGGVGGDAASTGSVYAWPGET
jgi:hypothetical protein